MTATRALVVALVALLAVWCGLCLTVLRHDEWWPSVDSAIYLLTAQSLEAGEGYSYLGRPFFVRPPGLSFLLRPFVDGPLDFVTLNLLAQLGVVAALAAVAAALVRRAGMVLGLAATLLFALHPLTVGAMNQVLSEFPFMALFFAATWLLLPDREGRQVGLPRAALGATALAASLYFRAAGLALIPGLVAGDLFRREGRRWQGTAAAGLAVALYLPWMVHAAGAAEQAERPTTQLMMFDYTTALLRTNPGDPTSPYVDLDGWRERVFTNAADITERFGFALTHLGEGFVPLALTVLAAAAILASWIRRRSLLDWYAVTSVALLLVYFTFTDRLLVPFMPVVLLALVEGARDLGAAVGRRAGAPHLATGCAVLVAVALAGAGLARLDKVKEPDWKQRQTHRGDRDAAEWIRANTRDDDRVLHARAAVMHVLTGRPTFTYRNLRRPWPRDCPEVDWAVFGPWPTKEPTEIAVAAVATEMRTHPSRWFQKPSPVRAYRLSDR